MAAAITTNSESALTTPTYDESGQMIHPSVLDFGVGGSLYGTRYVMAGTPYTDSDNSIENPSILVSDDKTTWTVPVGLTNPLDTPDNVGEFYADTCLIFDQDSKLWCVWKSNFGSETKIFAMSTLDGTTWTEKQTIISYSDESGEPIVSPSIIWDGTNYRMFSVNKPEGAGLLGPPPLAIEMRTASSISGEWSDPITVSIPIPGAENRSIWHLNVICDESVLYCIAFCYGTNSGLFLGISYDLGLTWTMSTDAILQVSASGWDKTSLYQASILKTTSGFDMWYSAYSTVDDVDTWGIGYTPILFRIA